MDSMQFTSDLDLYTQLLLANSRLKMELFICKGCTQPLDLSPSFPTAAPSVVSG